MKKEKIILSFIAVVFGLLVATVLFYAYQTTKTVPQTTIQTVLTPSPTATPKDLATTLFLTLDQPADESVVTSRSITLTGKTLPHTTLLVSTGTEDQALTPTATGSFSTTITIAEGENKITLTAIGQNGVELTKTLTVTYSTEEF